MTPETSQELRAMVREVLRDVMALRGTSQGGSVEAVRISNDAELAQFVSRLLDPAIQERVRTGKLRFTLGSAIAHSPAPTSSLTGVITEQKIDQYKGAGRLVLEPGAVLTPLARDRARKLGLSIERKR